MHRTVASRANRRYRRSRHLVCYWKDGRSVVHNYATGVESEATPLIWRLLDLLDGWRTPGEVERRLTRVVPAPMVANLLESLVSASFAEASDRPRDPRERRMDGWSAWNPAAGFYHTSSRQCRFGSLSELDRRLRIKAQTDPMPPPVKGRGHPRLALPRVQIQTDFTRTLMERRTWRRFGNRPLTREQLAQLLGLTSGITHWLRVPGIGEVPLTTSPSGGSRHPVETYVFAARVEGLAPAIYRYAPDRHELEQVRSGAPPNELRELIPHQPWFSRCAAAVFFTAVFERTQWRYESTRAYRVVLLEAGHMCQTFLLAATSLGLAPFCTMATDDAAVERLLGIDGVGEALLYAAGVGSRPRRAGRIVMPAGTRHPAVRVNEV